QRNVRPTQRAVCEGRGGESEEPAFTDELSRRSKPTMSPIQTVDRDNYDPSWITGKVLNRHFSMPETLFEFSRLFRDEEKDRALAIVGGAFLDTLLENILTEFLVDVEKEVGEFLRYDGPVGTYSGRIGAAYCLGL